jgi:hypothetical protein
MHDSLIATQLASKCSETVDEESTAKDKQETAAMPGAR